MQLLLLGLQLQPALLDIQYQIDSASYNNSWPPEKEMEPHAQNSHNNNEISAFAWELGAEQRRKVGNRETQVLLCRVYNANDEIDEDNGALALVAVWQS